MSRHDRNDRDAVDHHDHEKIVDLGSFPTRFGAETIVAQLEAEGITASLGSDDAGGWQPGLGFSEGYHVMVLENDVARAREIIGDAFD